MAIELAGVILDAVLGTMTGHAYRALPEQWRKRAQARWRDVSPFAGVSANHDLVRAARLAWIEAAFDVFKATEEAAAAPKWADTREALRHVIGLARRELRGIRDDAYDRQITPRWTPIDAHLPAILEGAPELVVPSPHGDAGTPITASFSASLASIIDWPAESMPILLEQIATEGIPAPGDGPRRSFGELVLAAFGELIKHPTRYPEAGAAFGIAMQKMVLDLQRAMLPLLEGLPDAVAASIASLLAARDRPPIETGRVDLESARDLVRDRPAELLIARYQATRFFDRGNLLADLLHWATEPGPRRAMGRLCPAPGGCGKTRLGIELIETLEAGGWRASFMSGANVEGIATKELSGLFDGSGEVPGICVVIDYAEGQIERLRAVTNAAARLAGPGPLVRIVALARSAAGWWDGFSRERGAAAVFAPLPTHAVAAQLSVGERRSLFTAGRQDFVRRLAQFGIDYDSQPTAVPDLGSDSYSHPLGVLAAAFLSARGRFVAGESPFETLYMEERRHWQRIVGAVADDASEIDDLARAAAQTTLVQGAGEEAVRRLIEVDGFARQREPRDLLRDLRRLYDRPHLVRHEDGRTEQRTFVGPIEPDLLGEHAAMSVLADDRDGLLVASFRAALDGPPLHPRDPGEILTVLSRSTRPEHTDAVRGAANDAIATLCGAVGDLTLPQATALAGALPPYSLALLDLGAITAKRMVRLSGAGTSEDELASRARALNNLGVRLSALGRREEALAASQEAVELYRRLAAARPDAFLPDLASSVSVMSDALAALDRHEEAARAAVEALEMLVPFVERYPERYGGLGRTIGSDILRYSQAAGVEPSLPLLERVLHALGERTPDA